MIKKIVFISLLILIVIAQNSEQKASSGNSIGFKKLP
jgi:hypothetical protein